MKLIRCLVKSACHSVLSIMCLLLKSTIRTTFVLWEKDILTGTTVQIPTQWLLSTTQIETRMARRLLAPQNAQPQDLIITGATQAIVGGFGIIVDPKLTNLHLATKPTMRW
jgi:hypothetical protein